MLRPHLWQFYATCILLGMVGNGAAHLAFSRAISTWFHQRLGMALALVMAGAGLGSMILPFFAQTIISRAGWRAAYLSLGGLALVRGAAADLAISFTSARPSIMIHLRPSPPAPPGSKDCAHFRSGSSWPSCL